MIQPVLLSLLTVFLFVLPIPGTIALRYGLLLCLVVATLVLAGRERSVWRHRVSALRPFIAWHGVLLAWFLGQAVLISPERAWALKEIRGQWLPAVICAVVGFGVALLPRLDRDLTRERVLTYVVMGLGAQTAFSILVTLPDFLAIGAFPQGKTNWTAGKLEISYWNNLLLAFLAVDILSRWRYRVRQTDLHLGWVVGGIFLVLSSNIMFGARNGIMGSLLLLFSLFLVVMWRERQALGSQQAIAFLFLTVTLVGLLGVSSYVTDSRWQRFAETAALAWQIEHHDAWLNPDDGEYPKTTSGTEVDPSAYLRIAWIRAGLDLIVDHPLGIGYGRNAFGHALRLAQETRLGHAHSGAIDLTIGVGVPGVLLWLGFLGWMTWQGGRRYFQRNDALGLITVFVTGGFFGRMLLDSINRDHMLMLFFLISAMLLALPERRAEP